MSDVDDPIAAAKARYAAERAKRLRADGNAQYKELDGDYADFDRDPWVEPGFTRDPIVEETTVVVLGGGFAGMLTAVELGRRGITDYRLIEKGGDFGGTWYWNRYPGCMCDVESYTYLPLLEETGYMPTEKYASAPEIFAYCQMLGRHFDLYPHALFQTEIADAVWDDETARWHITTTRGDRLATRFFITAGGVLHKAKLPAIDGIEDFAGHMFHTARWDYAFTGGSPTEPMHRLAGRRVGVVGTGATAVQAVPRLAEAGAEVFVFQRTPSAVGVRGNGPTDEEWFHSLEPGWQDERLRNFTQAVTGEKPPVDLVGDGWTDVLWENTQRRGRTDEEQARLEQADFDVMERLRRRIDEEVHDPVTAARLKPWYGKHCKRVCFHDEYLAAFNRPNVHLVDTDGEGVRRMNAAGVVIDGIEYPLDGLIFASGFEVTTALARRLGFDPVGRDGVPMSRRWSDGAHTLHGVLTAGFPNLLIISTTQAGFGTNFVHFLAASAHHVSWIVDTCRQRGIRTIEATPPAEDDWLAHLYGLAADMAHYASTCTPGYYNSEGQMTPEGARNVVYPGSLLHYADELAAWRAAGDLAGTRTT